VASLSKLVLTEKAIIDVMSDSHADITRAVRTAVKKVKATEMLPVIELAVEVSDIQDKMLERVDQLIKSLDEE
jgi:hypothetical protein